MKSAIKTAATTTQASRLAGIDSRSTNTNSSRNSNRNQKKYWVCDQKKYSTINNSKDLISIDDKIENLNNTITCVKHNSSQNVIVKHPIATSSRQLTRTNSIDEEMTHFKPIRLMPMSGKYVIEKIRKIPTIRCASSKENLHFYSPSKSKFKPETRIKIRRSAFCLVKRSVNRITVVKSKSKSKLISKSLKETTRTLKQSIQNGNHVNQCNAIINDLNATTPTTKTKATVLTTKRKTRQSNLKNELQLNRIKEINNSCENHYQSNNTTTNIITTLNSPKPTRNRYFLRARSKPLLYFPKSTANISNLNKTSTLTTMAKVNSTTGGGCTTKRITRLTAIKNNNNYNNGTKTKTK